MTMKRRNMIKLMAASLVVAGSALPTSAVVASELKGGIIRLVVGVPPGGPTDLLARLVAPRMANKLGANVIVENKSGAGQTIAANDVAHSEPDGRTLLFCTQTLAANPYLYKNLNYDPVNAFRGVSLVASLPYGLFASKDMPTDNLQDLIKIFRDSPGKYNFASSGASSLPRLAGEVFTRKLGLDIEHVPYAGSGPALISLASNETQIFFSDFLMLEPLIKQGRVKPIATAYENRLDIARHVPTFAEQGVSDFSFAAWFGVVAPQKTPDSIVQQLNGVINEIIQEEAVRIDISQKGAIPRGDLDILAINNFLDTERAHYKEMIEEIGL